MFVERLFSQFVVVVVVFPKNFTFYFIFLGAENEIKTRDNLLKRIAFYVVDECDIDFLFIQNSWTGWSIPGDCEMVGIHKVLV